jgi:hypothetical protein
MTNNRLNRGPPNRCSLFTNATQLHLQAAPRPWAVNASYLH